MRTETPPPPSSPGARLRAGYARTRQRIAEHAPGWSRGLVARWPASLAVLAVVGVAAGLAVLGGSSGGTRSGVFVRSGETFSRDDLELVRRALDAKRLAYRIDRGRVEVAAGKLDDANDVIGRLEVGPRPLSEIEKAATETSLLDTPGDKEQRLRQARNDELGSMIRRVDGVTYARVWVNRPPRRLGQRTPLGATAFVYLETEADRELAATTVEDIVGLVSSFDPDVKPDAVSICDRRLQRYAVAHDPKASASVRDRAREGELGREIAARLDWIKGLQVSVRLVPAAALPSPSPVPTGALVPPASLPPLPTERGPVAVDVAADVNETGPAIVANQPLALGGPDPDDGPVPIAPPPPPPSELASPPAPVASADGAAAPTPPPSQALVWVKVPRSYYLSSVPGHATSLDELHPLMTRVETLVQTAVRHVVPAGELGEVTVSTIPDDPPPAPPPLARTDTRSEAALWVLGGLGVGAGGGLVVVLFHLAARRPAYRLAARSDRGRYKIDEAPFEGSGPGPGPSERVRELIRLNPEAAASVLHRWTGQAEGGPTP